MANAIAMIAKGMTLQTAPAAAVDLGTAPPETPYVGSPESLAVADHGLEAHSAVADRYEDRNDAGAVLETRPVVEDWYC